MRGKAMKGFMTLDAEYYEAETPRNAIDKEVPMRPSEAHAWDGEKWFISDEMKDAVAREHGENKD